MTTYIGRDGVVKAGATPDIVGEVTEFSYTETARTAEDSALGDDWDTFKAAGKNWTASITAWWDDSDTGQNVLLVGAEVAVELYPGGDVSGVEFISGTGIVTSVEDAVASRDDIVAKSFEIQGTGEPTRGPVTP